MLCARLALLLLLPGCSATVTTGPPAAAVSRDYTETIRGSVVEFDMVWVPEGEYWIGRHEVTWDEFLLYCDFEETEAVPPGVDAVTKPSKPLDVEPYDRDWGGGRRPAVGVSWNAAKQYCRWLSLNTGRSYRLPTEDEWTQACGDGRSGPLEEHAWFAANSGGMTQEVGRKAPNRRGLHDMLGNLWEYCLSPYDEADPKRAVLRGGSWKDDADRVTPEERLRFDNDWVLRDPAMPPGVWWVPDGDHLGFRVVRSPEKAAEGVSRR
ncbi:MAG: formylglycine-generating enzyme family protein [Phycisphaerae bacterium]|nr:formylglycine-generating enzyme family protein [Phycisphaerae bacterium]